MLSSLISHLNPRARSRERTAPAAALPEQSWSVVSTVSEPPELVEAFVAWHLDAGAERVFLFADDPETWSARPPALPEQVTVTLCDETHWRRAAPAGKRPSDHRIRQMRNASRAYDWNASDWLVHIDADEFVLPRGGARIGRVLAAQPPEVLAVYGPVFEQVFRPGERPESLVFSGRFRTRLPKDYWFGAAGRRAFPKMRECFRRGMLAHCQPKIFLRRGLDLERFGLHEAVLRGEKAPVPAMEIDALALLHFDAGTVERWRAKFASRAYDDKYMENMGKWIRGKQLAAFRRSDEAEGATGTEALFDFFYCLPERSYRIFRRHGSALEADLDIPGKLAAMARLRGAATPPANSEVLGARFHLRAGDNFTETYILNTGAPREAPELERMAALVAGRRVLFLDVGANCGLYTVTLAQKAAPGSAFRAFEPNPALNRRLRANLALNPPRDVEVFNLAVSAAPGCLLLDGGRNNNLGEARIGAASETDAGLPVKVRPLADFIGDAQRFSLLAVKVDAEGHEPEILTPFLDALAGVGIPVVVMFEHAHLPPETLDRLRRRLDAGGFETLMETKVNLLAQRSAAAAPQAPASAPRADVEILIHAGIHRTGSTSIQQVLASNRPALALAGAAYPGDAQHHQSLAWALRRGDAGVDDVLAAAAGGGDAGRVILSGEDFCALTELDWLCALAERHAVRVVLYLRRQDHWLMSWYNQHVKWPFSRELSSANPEEFLAAAPRFHWIDYAALLDRWSAAVGSERLVARVVEPGAVENVVADFLEIAGLDANTLKTPKTRENVSLPPHLLEIARHLGLHDMNDKQRMRVLGALRRGLADKSTAATTVFSPARRRAILADYAESNARAAQAYFGRETLFQEREPDCGDPFFVFPDCNRETLMREWVAPVLRELAS